MERGEPVFESGEGQVPESIENLPVEAESTVEEVREEVVSIDEKPKVVLGAEDMKNESVRPTRIEEEGLSVSLTEKTFENGNKSYVLEIDPKFVQECYLHDQDWNEEFRKNIGPDYPYTMSPKTTELIASRSSEVKSIMSKAGFEIDPWKVGTEEEPYVMGVLRRVMVTDTIEPIIGYTDKIANYLKDLKEKNPQIVPTIRSFFCGATVADKSLITRMAELGLSGNLIATDKAADSIAVAALNFTVWNELLPEKDKYEIHLVRGRVPKELYSKDKTIVLQVAEAMEAAEMDSEAGPRFDALILDNGLQYVSKEFTEGLISNVLPNVGKNGLYIGALGLDANIKVDIPKTYHVTQIMKALTTDLRKSYKKKMKYNASYDYPHTYSFSKGKDGLITIDKVVSDGAGRMYMWLKDLIINDRSRFKEVMAAIKSATELSRANNAVETTPFDYHQAIVNTIRKTGVDFEELEKPLNYEGYGWKKVDEDLYSNGEEKVDGGTMMRIVREEDPLVLRRSRIKINTIQE